MCGTDTIAMLVDRLLEAADSEENRRRKTQGAPGAVFNTEDPIAWWHLFGLNIERYFNDVSYYVEQTLRFKLWRWETFPDDDLPMTAEIPAWLSHYPEYTFVGLGVRLDQRGVPVLQDDHPISRDPNLVYLKPVKFMESGWMPRCLAWYDSISQIVGNRLKVTYNMLWWRGCLDLAIQLRGYNNFLIDCAERPAFIHDLLRFLTEQRCCWHEAYCAYFGIPLGPANLGDDWINIPFISPSMFADFVLPRYLDIESFHCSIEYIHSCGNQTPVQKYLLQIKSLPTFEISPWTNLDATLKNVPSNKHLVINLHPNDVLCNGADLMRGQLESIVSRCGSRFYSIGTSGLTPLWDNKGIFEEKILTWTRIAQDVFKPVRNQR